MKETKRNLKILSIVILAMTVYSLIRVVLSVFTMNFDTNNLPDGVTAGILLAGQIVTCVISLIILLPQVYVGVKGIKISNNPDSSKAHIVWAVILAIFSIIGLISPVSNLIQNGDIVGNLFEAADMVIDTIIFIAYIKYAKQLSKAA